MQLRQRQPAAAAALLATSLAMVASMVAAAPPASATPVFVDAQTAIYSSAGVRSFVPGCTATGAPNASPPAPVVENGPAAVVSSSVSGSGTNTNVAGDTAVLSAQSTGSASVASVAGNPTSIDLSVTGAGAIDTALPTSACIWDADAGYEFDFQFTVAQAGFLHLTSSASAGFYGSLGIMSLSDPGGPDVTMTGFGLEFDATHVVFLPAGSYSGEFDGYVEPRSTSDRTASGTVRVHGDFVVAGTQTAAISGKGKRYVTPAASRSCSTHGLSVSVTGKKRRAEDIKQVAFFVNDHKVKTVKTPKKGQEVTLPLADHETADLVAEVKLFPKAKGRHAKVQQVAASYEACS